MTVFDGLKRLFGLRPEGEGSGGADGNAVISCNEAKDRLFEYLDGELAELSHEEVKRHLKLCKECYPRFQFEKHFLEALHTAEKSGSSSPELKDRILKVLAEEGAKGSS